MDLLTLFLELIEKNGGIAKTYDVVSGELLGSNIPIKKLENKRLHVVKQEYGTKYIKENYKTKSIKQIAEHLGTNFSMVQERIKQLGLKKPVITNRKHLVYKGCKILNIESGKVFENMADAARSQGLNSSTFYARIRRWGCSRNLIKVA